MMLTQRINQDAVFKTAPAVSPRLIIIMYIAMCLARIQVIFWCSMSRVLVRSIFDCSVLDKLDWLGPIDNKPSTKLFYLIWFGRDGVLNIFPQRITYLIT